MTRRIAENLASIRTRIAEAAARAGRSPEAITLVAVTKYVGEEEVRALGDPDFPGIEQLPIRPRVATAPVIERP